MESEKERRREGSKEENGNNAKSNNELCVAAARVLNHPNQYKNVSHINTENGERSSSPYINIKIFANNVRYMVNGFVSISALFYSPLDAPV